MKKQLIIVGLIVILLTVGLSGCTNINNAGENNRFVGTWTDREHPITQVIFRANGTLTMIHESFYGLTKSNGTYKILNDTRMDWDFGDSWTWKNSYYAFITDDILTLQMNLGEGKTYSFDRTK